MAEHTYEEEIAQRAELLRPFIELMTMEEILFMIAELDYNKEKAKR